MIYKITLAALAFAGALTCAGQGIKATRLSSSQVPAQIKYNGKFKDGIRFTDKDGDHIIITTETGNYENKQVKHEADGSDAELYAFNYIIKGNSVELKWKIYDFIHDCPVDLEASFVKNTLQVTDLNNDGAAEVWVMYRTVCHGDVSPEDMKIIMYQQQQKFAMRGETKITVGNDKYEGGTYKFDKAFINGPKEFREFAIKLWNSHLM
jgi:hypothetical protein